jgi:biotin transporter BioY
MYYSYASSSLSTIILLVGVVLLFCYVAAWFMAMAHISESANAKGWDKTGTLWFIGLFATPITSALIVAVTPDKNEAKKATEDDLPAI